MKYKHTFEAAIAHLEEIRDLLQALNGGESVSAIEIDLALQKTRNFYEVLLMLKHPSALPGTQVTAGPVAADTGEAPAEKPADRKPMQKTAVSDVTAAGRPAEENPVPEPRTEKRKKAGTLSDTIESKQVLGESIHQPIQYQEISSRIQAKPIKNLAAAIGINERFLYIRELFGNDPRKYENAIEVMNNAASFNDAYNYMIREYEWDMDSELVQGLLELVRRKFITGQHE